MTSAFQSHLAELRDELERRRSELMEALSGLDDNALPLARPGGWTVAKVLDHIVSAEWHYAQLIGSLRGASAGQPPAVAILGVADAAAALDASRNGLLQALDGVSEEESYRLGTVGREEYSVVSVLENVAQHDHEHQEQVRRIHAETATVR